MPIDSLVLDILDQVQSGLTPEEACAGRPELLGEVRERLARLNRIRAELDDVFPEPGLIRGDGAPPPDPAHLPEIPGHVVESVLGRGGMGVVYKARHLRFNRPVAVKMMLAGGYAGPPELARFFREAEALAGLTHPNVVQVHEVGDLDGLPYYTMEFVEGGDLARALDGQPQQAQRAASLVALLAGAVEAAHRGGIVHRDLKPGNVLLTEDGTPKVTDFGLAHRFDLGEGLTRTGTRIGTPCYMAPEQADDRLGEVGPATDVYALGAILYEMLTGRPPFKGKSASEIERQVISDQPVPPSKLNAKVSRDLETICLKCLQKDRRDRYTSAKDLEDDLNRFRQGEPIAARPVGWLERTAKAARRRPGLALAAGEPRARPRHVRRRPRARLGACREGACQAATRRAGSDPARSRIRREAGRHPPESPVRGRQSARLARQQGPGGSRLRGGLPAGRIRQGRREAGARRVARGGLADPGRVGDGPGRLVPLRRGLARSTAERLGAGGGAPGGPRSHEPPRAAPRPEGAERPQGSGPDLD
ncbi:serine/threonine-protein kinase [Singulisphaera sp. PoT]|uniref:serine/threonine-protein kinase n=1 Tax=Singulisphaera sp. PoT TaxID=3411797 RepID=UPI003BF5B83F